MKQASVSVKSLQKQIQQLNEKLIQSERMNISGIMLSSITHDLNRALTNILGTVGIQLLQESKDNSVREDLERIKLSAQTCREIINNLLNFARAEFHLTKTNLHQLIDLCLDLCQYQLVSSKIEVIKNYSKNMFPVNISISYMEYVFINLILNAVDAVQENGRITITTDYSKKSNRITIKISDNGCGISEKNISNIFKPFFTTKSQRMGLGLAMADRIVKKHNGLIKVESKADKGSSFIIELPACR
ncbi:MAG: hypothetical protein A2539_02755 [Elusimicrobia bacterium RIFOXYD2_FULL_34_15]|nr:MAG: hypothetical protein A2539_02755 [Elusimicrobia bacterium RIFOXYD2_FULL_34_15]